MLVSHFSIGDHVKLVVPYGPNAGLIVGFGTIVFSMNSSIDGMVYDIKREHGTIDKETSESWVKPAWD